MSIIKPNYRRLFYMTMTIVSKPRVNSSDQKTGLKSKSKQPILHEDDEEHKEYDEESEEDEIDLPHEPAEESHSELQMVSIREKRVKGRQDIPAASPGSLPPCHPGGKKLDAHHRNKGL